MLIGECNPLMYTCWHEEKCVHHLCPPELNTWPSSGVWWILAVDWILWQTLNSRYWSREGLQPCVEYWDWKQSHSLTEHTVLYFMWLCVMCDFQPYSDYSYSNEYWSHAAVTFSGFLLTVFLCFGLEKHMLFLLRAIQLFIVHYFSKCFLATLTILCALCLRCDVKTFTNVWAQTK